MRLIGEAGAFAGEVWSFGGAGFRSGVLDLAEGASVATAVFFTVACVSDSLAGWRLRRGAGVFVGTAGFVREASVEVDNFAGFAVLVLADEAAPARLAVPASPGVVEVADLTDSPSLSALEALGLDPALEETGRAGGLLMVGPLARELETEALRALAVAGVVETLPEEEVRLRLGLAVFFLSASSDASLARSRAVDMVW